MESRDRDCYSTQVGKLITQGSSRMEPMDWSWNADQRNTELQNLVSSWSCFVHLNPTIFGGLSVQTPTMKRCAGNLGVL